MLPVAASWQRLAGGSRLSGLERTGGPGQRRQDAARKVEASESRVGAMFYCNRSVL